MRQVASKLGKELARCRSSGSIALAQRALSSLPAGLQHSTAHTNRCPEGSTASQFWPYAFALSAAAAWMEEACCDASPDHNHLTDARIKVMRAWEDVQQDVHRLQASSPFIFPGLHTKRLRTPDVNWKDGQLSINFAVQEGVKAGRLLQQMMALLGGQGSAVQNGQVDMQASQRGDMKVFRLCSPGNRFSAEISFPPDSRNAHVEILTQAPLRDEDVAILASVFLAVHGVTRMDHRDGFSMDLQHFRAGVVRDLADVFGHFGALAGAELDDGVASILAKMEDAFFPSMSVEEQIRNLREQSEVDSPGDMHATSMDIPDPLKEAASSGVKEVDYGSLQANAAVKKLEKLGAIVYPPGEKGAVDWGLLAGYEEQKELIEETLLLAMLHPEVYSGVSSKTRRHGGSNRPRAVLFEGPPGCGKTTSARVLAAQASAPLVYVPIEAIASKWYGESERILGDIFKAAEQLDSCLVFLDEIDSLATSRSSEMHEATRRILGVLLRQLDGFEGKRSIVIGATNRKQDLDAALRSRFSSSIYFQLPSTVCRQQILSQYAQQLSEEDLQRVAAATEGMSGRDLRDVCEQAERRTASKIIRKALPADSLPVLEDYMEAVRARQKASAAAKGVTEILSRLRDSRV